MRIRTVAKEGALAALAASKPGVPARERDYDLLDEAVDAGWTLRVWPSSPAGPHALLGAIETHAESAGVRDRCGTWHCDWRCA